MNKDYIKKLETTLKTTKKLGTMGLVGAVLATNPVRAETEDLENSNPTPVEITGYRKIIRDDNEPRMRISFPTTENGIYKLVRVTYEKNDEGILETKFSNVPGPNGEGETTVYGNGSVIRFDAPLNEPSAMYTLIRHSEE